MSIHKIFISYHHKNDQVYKDELVLWAEENKIFIDKSVNTGDISDDLTDQEIREKIRDEYLCDSTVTIILVGTETKKRKHIDWEIFSSMFDGKINKKSGVIIINLPSTNCTSFLAAHEGEKTNIFPENQTWVSLNTREEYESHYPYMPDRIIDNLLASEAKISVINWSQVNNVKLKYMIEKAYEDRSDCKYDLSRQMRRRNS